MTNPAVRAATEALKSRGLCALTWTYDEMPKELPR